jgi:hypothetical protein
MDAFEVFRLSQTVIVNCGLDTKYGVTQEVVDDQCVWTCASGKLDIVAGILNGTDEDEPGFPYIADDVVLQEE